MKIVISDLDGSLLKDDKEISSFTKETFYKLKESGVEVALATGRGFVSANEIKKELGLSIPLICNNGANVYDQNGELIFSNIIPKNLIVEIVDFFEEKKINYRGFINDRHFFPIYKESSIERYIITENGKKNLENFSDTDKMLVIDDNTDILIEIKELLLENFSKELTVSLSSEICLDINAKNCNKKEGVLKILETLDLDLNQAMAFGDNENDIFLLESVGHGVAMKGSLATRLKNINITNDTNNMDGVARYIKDFYKL